MHVYADVQLQRNTYRWKATKTRFPINYIFVRIILDSLKVISEKPQVNQVLPYIMCLMIKSYLPSSRHV